MQVFLNSRYPPASPTQARKRLSECGETTFLLGIVFVARQEHADAPHAVALLRASRERPRRRAAAPPSAAMNSRRRRRMLIWPSGAYEARK
jgi:hypothetical protein